MKYLILNGGELTELGFKLKTSFNTMIKHHLFQKFKLIERGKFNQYFNTTYVRSTHHEN
jgi:hypothetical protein